MAATVAASKTQARPFPAAWVARTDVQARLTLTRMRNLVKKALTDVDFLLWARDVIRRQGANLRDPRSVADAVKQYVATHLTFVRDPFGIESIAPPLAHMRALKTYGKIAGDCDDAATLSAAIGMALGLRAAFVIEAFNWGRGVSPYQHVYTLLLPASAPGGWKVNCDTTRDQQKLPPTVQRRLAVTV